MRQLEVAIIGLGGMGRTTIESLNEVDFISRIIGVDTQAEKSQSAKRDYGIDIYESLIDVWNDPNVELIYITTPGAYHAQIAIEALKNGKKVMTEKPMGVNREETEQLLETVKQTNGFLQVGFECRNYSKLYLRIKEIIASGEIGIPKHITYCYVVSPYTTENPSRDWKFSQDIAGGIFQEKLCHYIDLPRWWVGEKVCRYFCTKAPNIIPYYQIADNIECTYQFQGGCVSQLTFMMGPAHGDNPNLMREIDIAEQKDQGYQLNYYIVGTEGALQASVFHRELRVFYHQGKPGIKKSKMVRVECWERAEDHIYFHNTTEQNIDIARRAVLEQEPAIDPEDAAETMRLCYDFEDAVTKAWQIYER